MGNGLVYQVGADIKDFIRNMDKVERTLKRSLGQDALNLSQGLVTGLAALGGGMLALGGAGIKMAADMEQTRIAFTTMLGDAQRAEAFLQQLADFAAKTPFELPGLIESSKKLLAFGFSANAIIPMMTAIGDAVAGLGGGAEEINRVTLALGQMQAKGKVSAEEMNQLAELGIPAWRMLADEIGVSIPQAMKMAERGAITSSKAIPAILQGMTKQFGGLMDKQSTTLIGLFSTAKDNISASLRSIGEDLVETFDLKTKLAGANKWLGDFANQVKNNGIREALSTMIPPNLQTTIILVAGAIAGAAVPALVALGASAAAALVPLLPFAAAGAAIAALGLLIAKNWENPIARFGALLTLVGTLVIALNNAKLATIALTAVTKLMTAAQTALNIVMNMNPVGLIITAIGLLVIAGVALYKNWETVKRVALNAWGTIKAFIGDAIAKLIDLYADFIGMFSKEKAGAARQLAEEFRKAADAERQMVDERNENAQRMAEYAEYAEARKKSAAEKAERDATEASIKAANEQTNVAAGVTETKKDYLDDFSEAFDRAQDEAVTAFERAQEDETTAFQRGQEDRLNEFKAGQEHEKEVFEKGLQKRLDDFKDKQEEEKVAFQQAQADKLTDFKRGLEDEKIAFENAQADKKRAFMEGIESEKRAFARSQEDLVDKFKQSQQDEMAALKARHETERKTLEKEYDLRIRNLEAQQKALDLEQERENRAKRVEGVNTKLARAQEELANARLSGDSGRIIDAEMAVQAALVDQQAVTTEAARQEAKEQLQAQIDFLQEQKKSALASLEERQQAEEAAFERLQESALKAYERELEDAKVHNDNLLEERTVKFEREQELDAENFQRQQEDRQTEYERELEDDKAQFEAKQALLLAAFEGVMQDWRDHFAAKQAEALTAYQREQEDELNAWKRVQEDRKGRYKQELDDLKTSFKEKLGEQETFIKNWNANAAKLAAMAPSASGAQAPAGGASASASALPPGTTQTSGGSGSAQAAASVQASGGGGARLNMFAKGAVVSKPTMGVFGEAGPEAIMPLTWLRDRLQNFAGRLATGMAAGVARLSTSPAPAGSSPFGSLARPDTGTGGAPVQNHYHLAPGAVVIPANDLAEMKTVKEFFDRFPQVARAMG